MLIKRAVGAKKWHQKQQNGLGPKQELKRPNLLGKVWQILATWFGVAKDKPHCTCSWCESRRF